MRAFIRYVYIHEKATDKIPVVVINANVQPGDTCINDYDVLYTVNQTNYIYHDKKVLQSFNRADVRFKDGDAVTLVYDCKAGDKCNFPFCGNACPGSEPMPRVLVEPSFDDESVEMIYHFVKSAKRRYDGSLLMVMTQSNYDDMDKSELNKLPYSIEVVRQSDVYREGSYNCDLIIRIC